MGFFDKLLGKKTEPAAGTKMESAGTKVKDPVCGMSVDPKTAPAESEYMGKTYYFCAPGCKKAFDTNPAKYTGGAGHEMAGHGGGHHHM